MWDTTAIRAPVFLVLGTQRLKAGSRFSRGKQMWGNEIASFLQNAELGMLNWDRVELMDLCYPCLVAGQTLSPTPFCNHACEASKLIMHNLNYFRILMVLLLTLPAAVQAQFNYTTFNGTITITGYTGPGGAVVIPDTINGLPVTAIGIRAFAKLYNLTSVTIPNSVTSIETSAFASCTNLTSVTIPNRVTSIAFGMFSDCTSLTSVTIPSSVTSIGPNAFFSCTSLTSVMIPNSVRIIGYEAFGKCISLTSVTIGNAVTSIEAYAFDSCTNLTSVTIPNSVRIIGDSVFIACTSLSAITVATLNSFYSSVDGVLFNKSQTLLIQWPPGKAGSYTISNSVTSIEDLAFLGCTSLTNVTIPNSVTNLGWYAFAGCTSLTSITIPNNVTSIEPHAFSSCTSLTRITIPNSVTSIETYAFRSCISLTSVNFHGNAPSVDSSAFFNATNAIVYRLPETTGWGATLAGRPVVLWNPLVQSSDASFGVRSNRFGFTITGASNLVLVVEASTNLANPVWIPAGTNTLTDGSSYFSDPDWTNHPARFYRLRSP
jgi:hypothetical protein